MIDGSLRRIAILAWVLAAPLAAAAPPAPNLDAPSDTQAQDVTGLAFDPTGQYAMAVVQVDAGSVSLPIGGQVSQSKPDVFTCDFGSVATPDSAKNCLPASHRSAPSASSGLAQTVDATSFSVGSSGITARFAVGGPGDRVSFWASSLQSSLWEMSLGGGNVLNVSISPDATRIAAGVDAPATGGSPRVVVIEASQSQGTEKWTWTVTDADGNAGARPVAMEHARNGRYLAVGTTGTPQDPASGTLFFLKTSGARPNRLADTNPQSLSGAVNDLRVSDDGGAIVVGTTMGVYYFPIDADGEPQVPFYRTPGSEGVRHVALSRDGERFAAASGSKIHFYRHINDARVAEALGEYDAGAPIGDLDYDRTGRLLVAVAGDRVLGFAPGRAQPIWSFDATASGSGALDGPLRFVAVSEGGERFVVAGKTKVMPYLTRVAATLSPLDEPSVPARPASTARLSFRVTNSGSVDDLFTFRVTRPVGWTGAGPDGVALLPDESATVNVTVEVPAGQQPGSYPVELEVHSSAQQNASRATLLAKASRALVVPRSVALEAVAGEERFELLQGAEKTVAVTVRNRGNADGLVNFTVDQSPNRGDPWAIVVRPEQASVPAGGETTVSLEIAAPQGGLSGDKNVITLRAREGSVEATALITAYVDAEFGAELTTNETLEFDGRQSRTISIAVRNTGNTDDAFNITASLGAGGTDWNVTVHQPVVQIPRGGSRSVGVTIVPTVAEPRPATLTVRAVSQGSLEGDEATVQINLAAKERTPTPEEETSLIPGPSAALALAALAVAVAAARRPGRGGRP